MRIHVVGAVLGVVLEHEHHRVAPEGRSRERFDHATEGEIVVGHVRARRRRARARSRRVVVRQTHDLERGHVAALDERIQLVDPDVDSRLVQDREIESGIP